MIKRAFHIILVGWLINALVFFHPVFGDSACISAHHSEEFANHADNTVLDIIFNHFVAHKTHKKESEDKVFIKARYISARAANLALLLPQTILVDFQDLVERVCISRFKFWQQKVFLPPHHNYLFRLSPF